ncbi:glycerate kinase family protein [Limosilactobacillus viscerum]|uniref:glycerate kinase family protein n=1 Tax=Limosilactobacillus viscerum TaxID=2993450 RepID=UPI0024BAD276|nr:glycerate kinase [Limosilactobacillus viscerum]
MKFLIAPDSFKGSLTAKEAAQAIKAGVEKIFPDADYELVPMADGGEGTVQSLVDATEGQLVTKQVHNPLNKLVDAHYGLLGNSNTAVIEMAEASGIQYVDEQTKNPLITTTYGTGELILDVVKHGVDQIIIGIGGSATTDGGAGMAQALGAKLLDKDGNEIGFGGGPLADLDRIDISGIAPEVAKVKILIASDVTNPLTGKDGSAAVFGPQKGATPEMVKTLDANLHHYAEVIKRDLGKDLEMAAGAGAAGGLGIGLMAFTNSTMEKGVEIALKYSQLAERAAGTDYAFTGEGSIDFQTKFGKTPYGVATTVKKVAPAAPVIVLAGHIGKDVDSLYEDGIMDAIFATPNGAKPLDQAIKDAKADVAITAENIARLIKVNHG